MSLDINPGCSIAPTSPDLFPLIIEYFFSSTAEEMKRRGTDPDKLPSPNEWTSYMASEYEKPMKQKDYFCLTWLYEGEPIGHSCIDQIEFGKQAFTHLHIWKPEFRYKGLGEVYLQLSLAYYFKHFNLEKIYCQPNANNAGPNQVLKRVGFDLVKNYKTIPHPICFEQFVNLYVLEASES